MPMPSHPHGKQYIYSMKYTSILKEKEVYFFMLKCFSSGRVRGLVAFGKRSRTMSSTENDSTDDALK